MSKVSLQAAEALDAEADGDRRRSERTDMTVRVDYATVDELFSEFTRDVNEGGLFIETDRPRPPGTAVSMHFVLPGSSDPFRTTGRVVHVSSGDDGGPAGMGVEFDELSSEDSARIDLLIQSLRTHTR